MKTSTIVFSLLISALSTVSAQSPYEQKMQTSLQEFKTVKSINDYQKVAMTFDQISLVETEKWQPLYYFAQSYIMMSFMATDSSETIRDQYLAQSDQAIQKMIQLAPQESEVYALQGLHYTAALVINPMSRSQKYSPLAERAIQTSLAFDPNNPRAKQLKLSNEFGYAQFFGKDLSTFCDEAEAQLSSWDDYAKKGKFYPVWGKGQLQGIVNQACGTQKPEEKITQEKTVTEEMGNTLTIKVNNLKSSDGIILLELLNEKEEAILQTIGQVEDKSSTISLSDIPEGTYAVRFFHDANGNQQMDATKRGIPTESYGFSNNARGFMGSPKYKKMLFTVSNDTELTLKAR